MSSGVTAVTTASFATEVQQTSATTPVLVDFWAPWCGPCRMLGPVLEQLAAELDGRLKVVKINTDEEPTLAQQFQIRSIPAVKLFKDGRVVAEFVGAQPLGAVRQFVAPHLPRDANAPLEQARARLAARDVDGALRLLVEACAAQPEDLELRVELARAYSLAGRADEARGLLDRLPVAAQSEPAVRAAYALAHFAAVAASPDETDVVQSARVRAARHALGGEPQRAVDTVLEAMQRNRRYARSEGRKDALVALELLPADDAALPAARRRLAALLN